MVRRNDDRSVSPTDQKKRAMKIAILKERRPHETRVAATPESVKKLKALGAEDVVIEAGAGLAAAYTDEAYAEAGVTARDIQREEKQFTRAKGFDTFCPVGPWIETELDPHDFEVGRSVQTHLNDDWGGGATAVTAATQAGAGCRPLRIVDKHTAFDFEFLALCVGQAWPVHRTGQSHARGHRVFRGAVLR